MKLTPLGSEFESIIAGTVLFLLGGFICFLCCFSVTHTYLCYKRRVLKRRRHSVEDIDYAPLKVEPTEIVVVEGVNSRRISDLKRPSDASFQSGSSLLSSESTSTTNAT
ncbi:hypothetical protein M3Y94_00804200 [Aphelenchoides besseyi]|nr:hypothetical protein M3Y94_00804200 [Aphelenchoides besseyi]